jgi:hypothetical protein
VRLYGEEPGAARGVGTHLHGSWAVLRWQTKPGSQDEASSAVQDGWHRYWWQTVPSGQGGAPWPQAEMHCIHTAFVGCG